MGISRITTGSMSAIQTPAAGLKDHKSKSIQSKITETQQQLQRLSSEEELSVSEKANARKELQRELSGLNTELERHQKELLRSQRREQMLAKLQEEREPVKEEAAEEEARPSDKQQAAQPGSVIARNGDGTVILKEVQAQEDDRGTDPAEKPVDEARQEVSDKTASEDEDKAVAADLRPSGAEVHAMVSADASLQQARRLGTIVARTSDGVAVLRDKVAQAEEDGMDTQRQQAELKKLERQEKLAMAFQSSLLGEAGDAMKSVTEPAAARDKAAAAENNAYKNALNLSQEAQESQQRFYVSFG